VKLNRRQFFSEAQWQVMKWTPWLSLLGFQFHRYTLGPAGGYVGWVTFCGRLVGFVPQ
jgi:hypothetical protein